MSNKNFMIAQETKNFLESSNRRLDEIIGDNRGNLFQRFEVLYTQYNRLFNESYLSLEASGKLIKPRYSDFERATKLVIEFNGTSDILKSVMQGNQKDIDIFIDLLENDLFNINLANGVPQKDKDSELLQNLKGSDNTKKVQAILSLIYNVRNNIVHGEKHYEESQSLLLEPLINIFQPIIKLQIDKLS